MPNGPQPRPFLFPSIICHFIFTFVNHNNSHLNHAPHLSSTCLSAATAPQTKIPFSGPTWDPNRHKPCSMLNRDTYREKEKNRTWDHETLLQKKVHPCRKKGKQSMTSSLWIVVGHLVIGDTDGPAMDGPRASSVAPLHWATGYTTSYGYKGYNLWV